MADYPGAIPVLGTYTGADFPQGGHINIPNREIEAFCTEIGVNPRSIDDTVAPGATPASVAVYLDMLANIVKTLSGALNWYSAAVPARMMIAGHGGGQTVAASSAKYAAIFGHGLNAAELNAKLPMTLTSQKFILRSLFVKTLTAQPGVGGLDVILLKNGAVTSPLNRLTIPASAAAGIYFMRDSTFGQPVTFAVNDVLSIKVSNLAANVSAQIGAWAIEMDQAG